MGVVETPGKFNPTRKFGPGVGDDKPDKDEKPDKKEDKPERRRGGGGGSSRPSRPSDGRRTERVIYKPDPDQPGGLVAETRIVVEPSGRVRVVDIPSGRTIGGGSVPRGTSARQVQIEDLGIKADIPKQPKDTLDAKRAKPPVDERGLRVGPTRERLNIALEERSRQLGTVRPTARTISQQQEALLRAPVTRSPGETQRSELIIQGPEPRARLSARRRSTGAPPSAFTPEEERLIAERPFFGRVQAGFGVAERVARERISQPTIRELVVGGIGGVRDVNALALDLITPERTGQAASELARPFFQPVQTTRDLQTQFRGNPARTAGSLLSQSLIFEGSFFRGLTRRVAPVARSAAKGAKEFGLAIVREPIPRSKRAQFTELITVPKKRPQEFFFEVKPTEIQQKALRRFEEQKRSRLKRVEVEVRPSEQQILALKRFKESQRPPTIPRRINFTTPFAVVDESQSAPERIRRSSPLATVPLVSTGTSAIDIQRSRTDRVQRVDLIERQKTKTDDSKDIFSIQIQHTKTDTRQKQRQITDTDQITRQRPKRITRTGSSNGRPKRITRTGSRNGRPKRITRKKPKSVRSSIESIGPANAGYDVIVKTDKRRFSKINRQPLTRKSALGRMASYLDRTADRSGTVVRKSNRGVRKPRFESEWESKRNQFRQSKRNPRLFVEKAKFAINTPGEFKAITAKGIRARKSKGAI